MTAPNPPGAPPGAADIEAAAARIAPYVRVTPTLPVELDGRVVELKLECLQVSGTFKARGAFARLLAAREAASREGKPLPVRVVAASGGNHGIAVAHAARALGMRANVFVPRTSPRAKLDRLRALGATVHAEGDEYAQAYSASRAFAIDHGALESHAYDQFDNAARAKRLGVSATLFRTKVTPARLAQALREVLDTPGPADRAKEVAQRIAPEDGAVVAAEALETLYQGKRSPRAVMAAS